MAGAVAWSPFGRLWSAAAAANVGDGIRAAAFPLIAVTFTQDPLVVSGLAAAATLPWLLFGLLGGAVVDRVDRRRLAWTVNAARAVVLGGLLVALAADIATVSWLYVAAFVIGIGETLADTAVVSVVPALVPRDELERANGRLVSAEVAGNEFVGPLLGSLLFSAALLLPVAVDAASLAVAAALLFSLPATGPPPAHSRTPVRLGSSVAEGLRVVWRRPRLRAVVGIGAALSFADAAWFSLLVLYAVKTLGLPKEAFGALLAAGALGGVLGGLAAGAITRRVGKGAAAATALILTAVAQLVFATGTVIAVAASMLALSSGAFAIWNTVSATERQVDIPDQLLGRVNATYRTLAIGAAPLGALVGGLLARQLGLTAPLLAGVAPLLLLALLALRALKDDGAH